MVDIGGWFLQRRVRQAQARAQAALQRASAMVQQARTTNDPQQTNAAVTALTQAIREAATLMETILQSMTRAQQRAQGRLPSTLTQGVERERQALTFLAQQTQQLQPVTSASPHGALLPAPQPLQHADVTIQSLQAALTSASTALQQLQAAQTADHQRQQYLAQYGGVDPDAILAQIESGQYPTIPTGVLLRKNELALLALPVTLAEDRTTRQYVGGYSGFSVPVVKGVRFRVGSYQGHSITQERLTRIDQGAVVVTTQRVIFTGAKRTLTLPVAKVLNTVVYRDGVDVRTENRVKREVFMCNKARLLNTFILIACQVAS